MLPRTVNSMERWSLRSAMIAAGVAILALATPLVHLTPEAVAAPDAAPDAAKDDKAAQDAAGQPIRVELPGGAVAEVLGVSEHPSKDQPWWAPDGSLTAPPYRDFPHRVHPGTGEKTREVAIRWIKRPPEVTVRREIVSAGSNWSGEPLDATGQRLTDIETAAHAFRAGEKTCTVRFTVAPGPWKTVSETDGLHSFSVGYEKYTFAYAPAYEQDGELRITLSSNVVDEDLRVVAIDGEGHATPAAGWSQGGGRGFLQTTAHFPKLKVADVKEFQVQVRPREIVEVRDVSLVLGEKTTPKVVLVDGPLPARQVR
ncbi:MAG: hypothetical protein HYX69_03030 [Planctomycetia bacterium]|nr:hypothetical protein [Planctomycetia bacterium]